MEAVQSQFGLEFAVAVSHARRDVDVDLRVDVVVDFGNGAAPVIGRILVEGGLDVLRVKRRNGQENRFDAVAQAFFLQRLQVSNDFACRHAGPEAVGADEDDDIRGLERQDIAVEAFDAHGARVTALSQVDRREHEIRSVAEIPVRRRIRNTAAAMADTVAEDSDDALFGSRIQFERQGIGIAADGIPRPVQGQDAPVERLVAHAGLLVILLSILRRITVDAMD